jgi:neutral ceramidase
MKMCALFLFTCLIPLTSFGVDLPEAPLRMVGAASADNTPAYPVRLSGNGVRRDLHQGVGQRIFAKELVIGSDAEGSAVLVNVDNCGVPAPIRDEVVKRLAAKTKVVDARFADAAGHTYCAPMLFGVEPAPLGNAGSFRQVFESRSM